MLLLSLEHHSVLLLSNGSDYSAFQNQEVIQIAGCTCHLLSTVKISTNVNALSLHKLVKVYERALGEGGGKPP